jgi:hypothetical protein
MADIAGFPYFEFKVDKEGKVVDAAARKQLVEALTKGDGVTDVFVISHGWNNDTNEAKDLYDAFFKTLKAVLDTDKHDLAERKFAIVGVFWPSKKFADSDLISGGAASVSQDEALATTARLLTELRKDGFDHPDASKLIDKAKALLPKLEEDAAARKAFVDIVRELPRSKAVDREDVPHDFFTMEGNELMELLAEPHPDGDAAGGSSGGAASIGLGGADDRGGAAGLGDFFTGIGKAALNLLNYTTYYQMKKRAGEIGEGAGADLLRDLGSRKLHLIGHSFGARLVTAAAMGPKGREPPPIATMTLLQGAFSHNGFALNYDGKSHDGFFRNVVAQKRISGPVLITHSINDKAVGVAYPVASRLAGEIAAAIGDENDPYGGMGRNGAQHTPERVVMQLTNAITAANLKSGKPHNLNGDALIDGHSDVVRHPEIANALLCAVSKT